MVTCPICGRRYERISASHLKAKHNMTLADFRKAYPDFRDKMADNSRFMKVQLIDDYKNKQYVARRL